MRQVTLRSVFSRVLVVAIAAFGAAVLISLAVSDPAGLARWGAITVAAVGWFAAAFWWPAVEVNDRGVRIVNVLRTITIPWGAIRSVDAQWSLEITTEKGTYSAFAAPRGSGGMARLRARAPQAERDQRLEESNPADGAQLVIARHLAEVTRTDEPEQITPHTAMNAGLAVLTVAGIAALVLR